MIRRIFMIMLFFCFYLSSIASAEVPLKAAFIRDHQLWVKDGEKEIQLTKGRDVSNPKWSKDGRFIAFLDGNQETGKNYLSIYDMEKHESYQPYPDQEAQNFQWSPISNQLAYTIDGLLNITKIKNGRPEGFENVSLGVSDFAWFPNGKEFIISSQSNLLPTGWQPIQLFKAKAVAHLDTEGIEPFYTIPSNTPELFAIDAEYFKWSPDGQWISFLAIPTASLSNDSNTLCVLSSKGDRFQAIGKMLWYKDWFKWAPEKNQLAYIAGEGRFFVEDKKTTVADIPILKQQKEYTPKGFVDLDLDWFSPEEVIVARAKEKKDWQEGPVPTMFTSLYVINIKTAEQKQISFPKKNELDRKPQVVGSYISWYRKRNDENNGDVWVKKGINGKEQHWLTNVDTAPVFYYK